MLRDRATQKGEIIVEENYLFFYVMQVKFWKEWLYYYICFSVIRAEQFHFFLA